MTDPAALTVAVTGPTGTFGSGLLPLLEAEPSIGRVVGIARRPFDPASRGWTKLAYRRGDVRDFDALVEAFAGADVVVHLAFLITGSEGRAVTRAVNVEGSLNVVRAAAAAGVTRVVYASSVAAYGFHPDNPIGMREEWPTRPAERLFYAQEKAELEQLLRDEVAGYEDLELYLLRPPIVLGPNAAGGKDLLPGPLAPVARWVAGRLLRLRLPVPVLTPDLPLQVIHEADVGSALLRCVVGGGPPGAYNIAADETVTLADVLRAFGAVPVTVPGRPVQRLAAAASRIPGLPPALEWVEALSHPAVMDTSKAKAQLGWEPRYTAQEAIDATARRDSGLAE